MASNTAPERIWANSSYRDNHAYGWWRNGPFEAGDEYIRKDISDARIAELEAATSEIMRLEAFIREFAEYKFEETRNFTGPYPEDEIESTTGFSLVEAFQCDARDLLQKEGE